ncbi:MAG: RNA polymerase sigma factor [Candidatus Halalkalibacterium sp. M3_1C_030]
MKYSDLAKAIKENDSSRINEIMKELVPRLKRFLSVHMNASKADAEDCAQETILQCIEVIKEDKLRDTDKVLSYILTSCRNNYLKMKEKKKEEHYEEVPDDNHSPAGQLLNLLDKERKRILEWCLNQLKKEYQAFMRYWFRNPGAEAEKVAEQFNLSVSNTWTRKHRLISRLNECYKKKSEL